jgi:hypothetical protein
MTRWSPQEGESSVLKCPWRKASLCRPRECGDPVDTEPPVFISGSQKIFALEYWVPAFAGTTAESHCFTSSCEGMNGACGFFTKTASNSLQ